MPPNYVSLVASEGVGTVMGSNVGTDRVCVMARTFAGRALLTTLSLPVCFYFATAIVTTLCSIE